jgi:hypothetical protein
LVGLALALFVARVLANDADHILPLHDAAAFTLPFNRGSDFHFRFGKLALDLEDKKPPGVLLFSASALRARELSLLMAEGNPPLGQVVGCHF